MAKADPRQELSREMVDRMTPETVAGILQTQWGGSTNMKPEDFVSIAKIAVASGMNPVFDLDILGGKPYDRADYWKGVLAQTARVKNVEHQRLMPGTPEWQEWIGADPEESGILVAMLCIVELEDRMPVMEASYVLRDDPILWENDGPVQEWATREEAVAAAGEAGRVWFDKSKRVFCSKGRALRADAVPLALKKARTTVIRRVAKLAAPTFHARALAALDRMEQVASRADRLAPVSHEEDPFSARENDEIVEQLYSGDAETRVDSPPSPSKGELGGPDVPSRPISEGERRRLMAFAAARGIDHHGLKVVISRVLGWKIDEVRSSRLTYADLELVIADLEEVPETSYGTAADEGGAS